MTSIHPTAADPLAMGLAPPIRLGLLTRFDMGAWHAASDELPARRSPRRRRLPPPLQPRSPRWAWRLLSWGLVTLVAPGFWMVGGLLLIDARSDHPSFWWSLPVIVAGCNALTVLLVDQRRHRHPFEARHRLACVQAAAGIAIGSTLFLLMGWSSRFLPEVFAPAGGAAADAGWTAALCSIAAALAFGIASFAHVGVVHVRLCFRRREGA